MRIAGAILLLLAGVWSLVGGSCSTFAGGVTSTGMGIVQKLAKASQQSGAAGDPADMARVLHATGQAENVAGGMQIAGVVTFLSGVLCLVAASLFFVNRGRLLGIIAAGSGIVGEVLFFTLAFFNWPGVVKVAVLLFGLVSANWVDHEPPPTAPPGQEPGDPTGQV